MTEEFVLQAGGNLPMEIKMLKGQRDALLEQLRKFREESPPRSPFEPSELEWHHSFDDNVSDSLSGRLKVEMRIWSRREAKDLSQLNDLQGSDRECFFKEVAKIVLLDGPDKQEFPKGLRGQPRTLITILEALLTHHLFTTVYPDPFFFLGEETSRILNDIMSLGNIYTLKLIHPLRKSPDELLVKSETKKLLRNAAISGATNFMRSPAKYIMKGHPDALQKLGDLYMQGAEHSYRIWGREPMIKLLDASNFLGQPFDLQNPYMKVVDRVYQSPDINPNGQPISMVCSPAILRYGLGLADIGYYEKRWWHEFHEYRRAGVWFHVPKPGDADQDFEEKTLPPRPSKDLEPATLPPRSDLSAEALGERMLKRFDRATLLDLVKPYLDDFAEQLRPVLEGLRGEIAQRIEERDEMEKQRDEFRSKYGEALQSIERLRSGM
ncbi:uncharacterized protein EAF02_009116 [Botrytis sinoallii]|uniref:uncharacterized protein n=1 Tax=Botrytis sinoallii TaxID=1463999 RepID=UPI0019020AF2|nr:uncharacterized protein EAF02_009116 [Botrytis sinoallii]KAF7872011.1 hypothetical protein EAF02_009116 [Botrytis sinoallii]